MFESAVNSTMTFALFAFIVMVPTSPAWLAGVLVAGRTSTLPVPAVLRPSVVRWGAWFLGGLAACFTLIVGSKPNGGVHVGVFVGCALVGLAALAVSVLAAFYIGWTTRVKWMARRRTASRAVAPWGHRAGCGPVVEARLDPSAHGPGH